MSLVCVVEGGYCIERVGGAFLSLLYILFAQVYEWRCHDRGELGVQDKGGPSQGEPDTIDHVILEFGRSARGQSRWIKAAISSVVRLCEMVEV
jgi:hypothetical protein